jgi:two-component system nitrogen regulation response regulator NtrX
LFFRLNVIPFRVPALRERAEDIPLLADHFLAAFAQDYGSPPKTLDESARAALTAYSWPGNVRELKNLIERLFIMCPDSVITGEAALRFLTGSPTPAAPGQGGALLLPPDGAPLKDAVAAFEKHYIEARLAETGFHMSETARLLGLERSHLYKKIKIHDIAVPGKGGDSL